MMSFQQRENRNGKFPLVCCKLKWKTEACFSWSANDKRHLTMAVSANMPIYAYCT